MRVAIGAERGRKGNIRKVLELFEEELRRKVKGRILLKPNLTGITKGPSNTALETIETVVEFFHSFEDVEEIHVGDGSGGAFFAGISTWDVIREMGYFELFKYPKVKLANLDEFPHPVEVPVYTIRGRDRIRIAALDYDFIVSIAIPKTHDYVIFTGGLKNMMGAIRPEDRLKVHGLSVEDFKLLHESNKLPEEFEKVMRTIIPGEWGERISWKDKVYLLSIRLIHENLAGFLKVIRPDFVVIDGYMGMEGEGPIRGEVVIHDFAIASFDGLAADALSAELMGVNPRDVGYLLLLEREGIGSMSGELAGDPIGHLKKKYRMHPKFPYQILWKYFLES